MSMAPERIWAYHDRAGYTFTALGVLPSYFGNVEYIRADLHAAALEAVAEVQRLREELRRAQQRITALEYRDRARFAPMARRLE